MWRCAAGWFTQEAWQLIYARVCERYWGLVEHGPQSEAPMCAPLASVMRCGRSAVAISNLLVLASACQSSAMAGVWQKRSWVNDQMSPG